MSYLEYKRKKMLEEINTPFDSNKPMVNYDNTVNDETDLTKVEVKLEDGVISVKSSDRFSMMASKNEESKTLNIHVMVGDEEFDMELDEEAAEKMLAAYEAIIRGGEDDGTSDGTSDGASDKDTVGTFKDISGDMQLQKSMLADELSYKKFKQNYVQKRNA